MRPESDGELGGEYWRSAEGRDHFEALLEERFNLITMLGTSARSFHEGAFDVVEIEQFPADGSITYLTKGLGAYILSKQGGRSCIRQELAWSVPATADSGAVIRILSGIAHTLLASRTALEPRTFVDAASILEERKLSLEAHRFLSFVGLWFQKEEFFLESFYPLFITELLPLTELEFSSASLDLDAFLNRCEQGHFDFASQERVPSLKSPPNK